MRPALPQTMATSGLRALIIFGLATLLTTTIWICMVSGLLLALRPVLGTAGAFLAVGGGLSILVLVVVAGVAAFGNKTSTRRNVMREEAIAVALTTLQSRRGRQLALGSVGVLLLVAAALMSAPAETDAE